MEDEDDTFMLLDQIAEQAGEGGHSFGALYETQEDALHGNGTHQDASYAGRSHQQLPARVEYYDNARHDAPYAVTSQQLAAQDQRSSLDRFAYQEEPRQAHIASFDVHFGSSPALQARERRNVQRGDPFGIAPPVFQSQQQLTPRGQVSHSQYNPHSARPATPQTQPFAPSLYQKPSQSAPLFNGIQIRSTHELPDRFRSVFPFPNFNAMQSKCFDTVYGGRDNFVLSSPTGSGKTAIFELAICNLINGFQPGQFKIVYQAPTKSLCSERQRDWQEKFRSFGLECAELTGDTDIAQLKNVQTASIIITTPEKFDSVTRKWKDHAKLMEMIKLFLIDEVHLLKDERGATLEAVVSRMKSIRSDVRFVALSATVPNSEDVAKWLGKDHVNSQIPAKEERFGEDFRPVRLEKHVIGYPTSGNNDFAFDLAMNSKLPEVITKYSHRKPIMVFCFTRKSCEATAKSLAEWWFGSGANKRCWKEPRTPIRVTAKDLNDCVAAGVAWHHAGLQPVDRTAIEKGFLNGDINVICCTSTLAVGVNLPCHLVIIKNTVQWMGKEGFGEYSDLEIMQMLGRAGRPQYDTSGVAVVLVPQRKQEKYTKMLAGQEVLESCLHKHLIDHLNAEISLGTVYNLSTAKKWLSSTFLYVRLRENPEHYRLGDCSIGNGNLDARLEDICCRDLELLREFDLVEGENKLTSTAFGQAMARYYVQFETAKIYLSLAPKAKLSEILSAIAMSAEFQDIRFRSGEKKAYKALNSGSQIRFPIPVNLDTPAQKVSLIIQAQLGSVDLPADEPGVRFQFQTEAHLIFQSLHRLVRCIVDFKLALEDSESLRNALFLCRSLGARCWDDSPLQMRQLERLGPVAVRGLVQAGVRSIEEVEYLEAHRIEAITRRNSPFGMQIVHAAQAFPKLRVSLEVVGKPTIKAKQGALVNLKAEIGLMNDKPVAVYDKRAVFLVFLAETSDGRIAHFARASARKVGKGQSLKFSVLITDPSQVINCYVMCDELAGTQRSATLKPTLPSIAWPTKEPVFTPVQPVQKQSNPMNTSKRRSASRPESKAASDEFDALDDDDLAQVFPDVDGFTHIDSLGPQDASRKSTMTKPPASKKNEQPAATPTQWQPTQLPNGKWACNHKCKDKTKCSHLCCREGKDKMPKAPKDAIVGDLNSTQAPAATQQKSSLQKGQTKLNLKATSKQAMPPSIDDEMELLDLSADKSQSKPAPPAPKSDEFKRLEKMHTKYGPSNSRITAPGRSGAFSKTSTTNLSFLPEYQAENDRPSSDYGDTDDLPDFGDLVQPKRTQYERDSAMVDELMGPAPDATTPHNVTSTEYDEGDSAMEDAMVGLADSQDLKRHENSFDANQDPAGTSLGNRFNYPGAQPPEPKDPRLRGREMTARDIAEEEDQGVIPTRSTRVRAPFFQTSSSPAVHGKTHPKRPLPRKDHELLAPAPKKHISELLGAVTAKPLPATRAQDTRKNRAASSTPPPTGTMADIDPEFLKEFGDLVEFV